jgi:cysteine desulfurase family protein
VIYLDNAATSFPKPEPVYLAMDAFLRHNGASPGRAGHSRSVEAGHLVEAARRQLCALFNGPHPDRLCFGHNATDALNLILAGTLQPGDHVVTTVLEHNSVLRPLHVLGQQLGLTVEHVACDARGVVDPDDVGRRLGPRTRLVVVTHASNVIGTVQPIAEIGRRCRDRGVWLVVDAAQTAGRLPIDMQAQHIDVLAFTGHKSLCGPTGTGGLCVGEGVEIRPTRAGGTGVRSRVPTHLDEYPYRLEYGTLNAVGVAGLQAGVRWVVEQGLEALHARELDLTTRLRDGLRAIAGVELYAADDLTDHIGVLLFNVVGCSPRQVGELLDVDHGIACRSGLHCAPRVHAWLGTDARDGGVRLSVSPFSTAAEIDATVDAVREIARDFARPAGRGQP